MYQKVIIFIFRMRYFISNQAFLYATENNNNRIIKITQMRVFYFHIQWLLNLPVIPVRVTILCLLRYILNKLINFVFKPAPIIIHCYHKLFIRNFIVNQHKLCLFNRQNKWDNLCHESITNFKLFNIRHFFLKHLEIKGKFFLIK